MLAAAQLARSWLDGRDARQVRVRIGEFNRWPIAAGVISGLERHDFDITVDRDWVSLFGDQFSPTDREGAQLWITGPAGSPPMHGAQRLGEVGGASLWAGRLEPGAADEHRRAKAGRYDPTAGDRTIPDARQGRTRQGRTSA